jgi:hypothetical protein
MSWRQIESDTCVAKHGPWVIAYDTGKTLGEYTWELVRIAGLLCMKYGEALARFSQAMIWGEKWFPGGMKLSKDCVLVSGLRYSEAST